MASYTLTGRSGEGAALVLVSIDSIDQENAVVAEIDVVEAVRGVLLTAPGVQQVVARKYEQVITVV